MYKLEFYVPKDNTEQVLEALFKAGAGTIGHYDCCCFITEGIGQFRPLEKSNPHVGEKNILKKISENKVEMFVSKKYVKTVKSALLDTHPYEKPAYQFFNIDDNL
ncbi:MAG: NGG1p interacting factor NIF3 [Bacteriovoracaceae bacterium]|jgi:structural toxin protein (hemagglutinin/hemolysin) RtxA|nr:NGG1p interacting factor NIF3 [Bacteriovoracaceae bacterium]